MGTLYVFAPRSSMVFTAAALAAASCTETFRTRSSGNSPLALRSFGTEESGVGDEYPA